MKLKEHLRIVWAITAKDITDAIKNKIVQGVLIGVLFMMLSSQALSLLVGLKDKPTAYFWDQGKSTIIKEIVRSRELNFYPVDDLTDLQDAVSQNAETVIGLVIPSDFDDQLAASDAISLPGYFSHASKPDDAESRVTFFEGELSRQTAVVITVDATGNELFPPAEGLGYPMMVAFGVVLGVMTVGLILTPYLIVDEKENHTLEALLISPAQINHLLIGKSLAGLFYSLSASLVIFAFSWRWIVHWDIMILATIFGGLCAVSIGLLVGASFETPTTVNMFVGLLLAGMLIPMYLWTSLVPKLSPFFQFIFEILPSIAMYKIVRQSFTEMLSANIVWGNLAVLLIWTLVVLGLVAWRIRRLDR